MSEREGNDSGKRMAGKTASRGDVWAGVGFENLRKGMDGKWGREGHIQSLGYWR